MDSLAKSVEQTIRNLQEKKGFLQQQCDRYNGIRQRIVEYEENPVDQLENGKMEVFGDVIISPERMFVNIGYEYYVEKTRDELLEYVDEKRKLIEQAIEQFDSKIKDGEKAMKSFDALIQSEQSSAQLQNKSDEQTDELPSMEIREELDEDGNVISSSVTPAMASLNQENLLKDNSNESRSNDFEQNLKGRLIEESPKDEEQQNKESSTPTNGGFATENMYTFADLVRQLDEQDEVDDEIDSGEVKYDFESFDRNFPAGNEDEIDYKDDDGLIEDSDNDDDDDENHYMIAPTMEAHSAFMNQLNKLREKKVDVKRTQTPKAPGKSILKTSSKTQERPKPKKSVGFASKLDIHEVENLKQENQRNRHNMSSGFMQPLDYSDSDTVTTEEEFDSELFAQLIGARGPDEIHDKYKSDVVQENNEEDERIATSDKKKTRVSRFKQERKGQGENASVASDLNSHKYNSRYVNEHTGITVGIAGENDVVERDPDVRTITDSPVGRVVDKSAVRDSVFEKEDERFAGADPIVERDGDESAVTDLIVEKDVDEPVVAESIVENDVDEPVVADSIVEKDVDEPVVAESIVEKDVDEPVVADSIIERNNSAVVDRIVENDTSIAAADRSVRSSRVSAFSKKMRSLQRSSKPRASPHDLAYEFSESSEDLSDAPSDPEDHHPGSKQQEHSENFPNEVMEKVNDTQRTISLPTVDYNALGDNLDSMVQAYSLGVYDDDLDEDPGTLLEKVEDFKQYNEQVEALKSDIEAFRIDNPMQDEASDDDGPLVSEILENEIPENYNEDPDEDLALEPSRLNESIAIEYGRLRDVISAKTNNANGVTSSRDDESKELEPINQDGEPIRLSRFKSQRLKIGK